MDETNVSELPYAGWLEESLQNIIKLQPDSMAIIAVRNSDGMTYSGYYQADAMDIGHFISNLSADFILEVLRGNVKVVKEILEEDEND